MRNIKIVLAALTVALPSTAFAAGTDTATMNATASVANNCIISAGDLLFGGYDTVDANADADLNGSADISVTCTSGASTKITLSQGDNAEEASTDAAPVRRLKFGTDKYLSYQLFQDSAWATVWGNTSTTGVSYTGVGTEEIVHVYGKIASGQNVPAGTYSDTVTVTVTF